MRDVTSALFVPGTRPDRFEKALASGADMAILDLEDAVPAADKEAARMLVEEWVSSRPEHAARAMLRINVDDADVLERDLDLVHRLGARGLGAVLVPKTESKALVEEVAQRVAPPVRIIALVETALGVQRLAEFADHPRLERLAFGAADFAADLGSSTSDRAMLFARSSIVTASAAARLAPALDSPWFGIGDADAARRHAADGRDLGFGGSLCIHPAQVPHIRSGYAPTPEETDWARQVLAADSSDGATRVGNDMVDAPVRRRAQDILRRSSTSARS
ncbi:HpcH/HpaI aldolase/citrate lyase family protein [Agrococcus sp. TSP3-2-1]|uniref:HpcH/HpaI aldolase/citrate lyase family protein n=1 Tax=Agrococcus sp. TSP3-2-1 TaxID=2804583 RepID=UPI003CF424AA